MHLADALRPAATGVCATLPRQPAAGGSARCISSGDAQQRQRTLNGSTLRSTSTGSSPGLARSSASIAGAAAGSARRSSASSLRLGGDTATPAHHAACWIASPISRAVPRVISARYCAIPSANIERQHPAQHIDRIVARPGAFQRIDRWRCLRQRPAQFSKLATPRRRYSHPGAPCCLLDREPDQPCSPARYRRTILRDSISEH